MGAYFAQADRLAQTVLVHVLVVSLVKEAELELQCVRRAKVGSTVATTQIFASCVTQGNLADQEQHHARLRVLQEHTLELELQPVKFAHPEPTQLPGRQLA